MNKLSQIACVLLFALMGATNVYPQSTSVRPFTLPGSAWNETGNYSPVESSILSDSYVEQGMTTSKWGSFTVGPYVSMALDFDSKGLDWENRVAVVSALRVSKTFKSGVVAVNAGYGVEDRFKSGMVKQSPVGFATYWFGWQAAGNKRFPGSSWGVLGATSPVERGNFIATVYAEQGVVVRRVLGGRVVPFGQVTLSGDAAGHDWNNRSISGGGLKLMRPVRHGLVETGASYLQERRFTSGLSKGGVNGFVKMWFGWSDLTFGK